MSLKRIVEQSDTRAGRWFDRVVSALIVVSLITFSIETLPNLLFFTLNREDFLIRDSPRPATTYEQKTGGADGVKGA